jgi:hypothetical protein
VGGGMGGFKEWVDGGMGGWVDLQKLITDLDMKKWLEGGSAVLALLYRYEVKKRGGEITLYCTSPESDFFFIYAVITWGKIKKSSANHYSAPR